MATTKERLADLEQRVTLLEAKRLGGRHPQAAAMTGDQCRAARIASKLTAAEFAAAVGVSAATVFTWERGDGVINADRAAAIRSVRPKKKTKAKA